MDTKFLRTFQVSFKLVLFISYIVDLYILNFISSSKKGAIFQKNPL